MPHYACPGCNQLFHEADPKAYVWCSCGQPLSAADMVDERVAPHPAEQPQAEAVPERALDQFDRRAMVGAVYSPCFLRAIVKRKVAELNERDTIFELAVSDGHDYAAIAVQRPKEGRPPAPGEQGGGWGSVLRSRRATEGQPPWDRRLGRCSGGRAPPRRPRRRMGVEPLGRGGGAVQPRRRPARSRRRR